MEKKAVTTKPITLILLSILIVFLVAIFYFKQRLDSQKALPSNTQNEIVTETIPYEISWDSVENKIFISGILQHDGLQTDEKGRFFDVTVPVENREVNVRMYFYPNQKEALVETLESNSIPDNREWNVISLDELVSTMKKDDQVLVYVIGRSEQAEMYVNSQELVVLEQIDKLGLVK